jgi:hypothetical protein
LQRIGIDPGPMDTGVDDPAAVAFDTREWLRAEGLWGELTEDEEWLLSSPIGSITPEELMERAFQSEAFAALAWSLGLLDTLSDSDPTEIGPVLSGIPSPWEKIEPWIAIQRLRPEPKIARRREQAEIWEWRLGVESHRRIAEGRDLMELEKAIKDVTRDGAMQGLLKPGKQGGFSVDGMPILRLNPFQLEELHRLAEERLVALNWVCGYGEAWNNTPLDV